jgi:hypothetical protein
MAASCYLGLQNIWDCAAIFATPGFRGALLLPIVAQATQGKRGVKHVKNWRRRRIGELENACAGNMSANGTKQTSILTLSMSVLGGKADIPDTPHQCPLMTQSGHPRYEARQAAI